MPDETVFDGHARQDGPSQPEQALPSAARRGFIQSAIAAMTASAVPLSEARQPIPDIHNTPHKETFPITPLQPVNLKINGKQYALSLEPRVTLLDALREVIGLTGTKKGCDRGQCGACTVIVDGRRINSCLTLAVMQEGREITTIEGLAVGADLHPLQAAFIECDAFQCGYCTPGQLCSAAAMLGEWRAGHPSAVTRKLSGAVDSHQAPSEEEIRERMSGNLCRCGAYPNIVAAIKSVAATGGKT